MNPVPETRITGQVIPFRPRGASVAVSTTSKPSMQPCVDIHGWYHEAAVQAETPPRGLRRP